MCAALGLTVIRLLRTSFGPIELGALAPGDFRALTDEEVRALDLAAGLPHRRRTRTSSGEGEVAPGAG
jgi:23S rRNA pseudouridine2605 synthase